MKQIPPEELTPRLNYLDYTLEETERTLDRMSEWHEEDGNGDILDQIQSVLFCVKTLVEIVRLTHDQPRPVNKY